MRDSRSTALLPLTANPDIDGALARLEALRDQQPLNEIWTVMVYMAGDNNLAEDMVRALKSMFSVGSRKNLRVFAYFDAGLRPAAFKIPTREERGRTIERTHPDRPQTARSESSDRFLENEGFLAMMRDMEMDGAPVLSAQEALERFVTCAVCDSPADRYMLVLSGHGNGAAGGDFLTARKRANGLTVSTLKSTLANINRFFRGHASGRNGRPIFDTLDILGMDSCNMSTAEVAYEVRGLAQFAVGAEGWEPNTGWPWSHILDRLVQISEKPGDLTPRRVAETLVEEYTLFYASDYTIAEVSTDQAAIDVQGVANLARSLKGRDSLPGLMIRALGARYENAVRAVGERGLSMLTFNGPEHDAEIKDAILLARWESQGFKDERNVDMADFCLNLARRCTDIGNKRDGQQSGLAADIAESCLRAVAAIEGPDGPGQRKAVILSGYCGPAFQHAHGLSVFFPWNRTTDATGVTDLSQYRKLDFGFDTDWARFLDVFTISTQRDSRKTRGDEHPSALNRGDWIHPNDVTLPIADENGQAVQFSLVINPTDYESSSSDLTIDEAILTLGNGKVSAAGRSGPISVHGGQIAIRKGVISAVNGSIVVFEGQIVTGDGQSLGVGDMNVASGILGVRDGLLTIRDGQIAVHGATHRIAAASMEARDGQPSNRDGLLTIRDGQPSNRDGLLTNRDGLLTIRDGLLTIRDACAGGQTRGAAGSEAEPKTSGRAGLGGGVKIASMKNPPIRWRDCDLVVRHE
jgi:hypothetical protein